MNTRPEPVKPNHLTPNGPTKYPSTPPTWPGNCGSSRYSRDHSSAVLADSSDGYTDVALVWAVAIAFTAMSVFAVFTDFYLGLIDDLLLGGWGHEWTRG